MTYKEQIDADAEREGMAMQQLRSKGIPKKKRRANKTRKETEEDRNREWRRNLTEMQKAFLNGAGNEKSWSPFQ